MKKLIYSFMILFVLLGYTSGLCFAQKDKSPEGGENSDYTKELGQWNLDQNPVNILDHINNKANKKQSDRVQDTKLNNVESVCNELAGDGRIQKFTITKTLCNIKMKIASYLQYIIYIGLTAATIILIRNGFQLVTAEDKGKQMGVFKKNIMYIVIGVVLLVAFYYILDIFVSVVNLVLE